MDKTIVGLLGAVGALAASVPTQAAVVLPYDTVMQASSYADLLRPIPRAADILKAAPSVAAAQDADPLVQMAADHHHHHRYYRRRRVYHRHHHHHHAQMSVVETVKPA